MTKMQNRNSSVYAKIYNLRHQRQLLKLSFGVEHDQNWAHKFVPAEDFGLSCEFGFNLSIAFPAIQEVLQQGNFLIKRLSDVDVYQKEHFQRKISYSKCKFSKRQFFKIDFLLRGSFGRVSNMEFPQVQKFWTQKFSYR